MIMPTSTLFLTFYMIGMIMFSPAWMLAERPIECCRDICCKEVLMTPPKQHAAATAEVDVRAFA
jgi:hypothetical protein